MTESSHCLKYISKRFRQADRWTDKPRYWEACASKNENDDIDDNIDNENRNDNDYNDD